MKLAAMLMKLSLNSCFLRKKYSFKGSSIFLFSTKSTTMRELRSVKNLVKTSWYTSNISDVKIPLKNMSREAFNASEKKSVYLMNNILNKIVPKEEIRSSSSLSLSLIILIALSKIMSYELQLENLRIF